MTNPEQAQQEQPKHRREREPLIGDHFIAHLVETAPDPEAAARIQEAYDYHGTAMAAFLGLDDTNPYDKHIVLDFLNVFQGRYPAMGALVDEVIETHGWNDALEGLYEQHPELQALLRIDRDGVADLIDMRFDVVDLGELYVFEK